MNPLTITIPITPVAWKRPAQNGKRRYDTQVDLKTQYALYLKRQYKQPPLIGPIQLDITFYMPMPKTKLKKLASQYHYSRPDTDNLEKFLMDCLTTICFKDDRQVAVTFKRKIYDPNPRTVFTISQL